MSQLLPGVQRYELLDQGPDGSDGDGDDDGTNDDTDDDQGWAKTFFWEVLGYHINLQSRSALPFVTKV